MPPPCGIIPRLLLAWICTKAFRNRPDIRRLVGGCAAAICRLQAATAPEPGDAVVGLGVDQVNRRFAAACAAADGRRAEGHRCASGTAAAVSDIIINERR